MLHIAGDRVIVLRQLAGTEILQPVPGVLRVGILGMPPAFQLDVCGHVDIVPAAAVEIRLFKARNDLRRVLRVGELPQPVQGQTVRRPALVIGMGIKPVLTEILRVLQSVHIKHGQPTFICIFVFILYHRRERIAYPYFFLNLFTPAAMISGTTAIST